MSAETIPSFEAEEQRRRTQRLKNQPAIDLIHELLATEDEEGAEELWNRLKDVLESSHTPKRKLYYDE